MRNRLITELGKLHKMPDFSEFKQFEKAFADLFDLTRDKENELAHIYSKSSEFIMDVEGDNEKIVFLDEHKERIRRYEDLSLISVHNHYNHSPPSIHDFAFLLIQNKCQSSCVITPSGDVYVAKKKEGHISQWNDEKTKTMLKEIFVVIAPDKAAQKILERVLDSIDVSFSRRSIHSIYRTIKICALYECFVFVCDKFKLNCFPRSSDV